MSFGFDCFTKLFFIYLKLRIATLIQYYMTLVNYVFNKN